MYKCTYVLKDSKKKRGTRSFKSHYIMFKVFKVNFQWEEKFLFFRHMDGHHKLVRWRMVIHGVACVAGV